MSQPEHACYQLEFHVPGFVEAFVLLPGEKHRRKFTDGWGGSTLQEQEKNSIEAIHRQYPDAIRLFDADMRAEQRKRGANV